MKFLTAKTRITVGLTGLILTLLVSISSIDGVGPNPRLLKMNNRVVLSESAALGCSILLNNGQIRDIETLLTGITERNENVASAGIRKSSGRLEVAIADHKTKWSETEIAKPETHVVLPLQVGKSKWGSVEVLFHPIREQGMIAWLNDEWIKYFLLNGSMGFFVIYFFLGYVLKQLDPSKAVPRRVRDALNTLAEGLIVTDRHGKTSLTNDAFSAWVGEKAEKLLGSNPCDFKWVFDQATQKANGEFANEHKTLPWDLAIENGKPQCGWLMKLETSDGRCLTLVANSSPFVGAKGEYVGVLTSFEDITELEEHKVELSKAKIAADEANVAKSEFLARMSHEIRTPMNAILGYTEVLRDGTDHDASNRTTYLSTIHNSGEHLLALINDILDLSKVESGKMELELRKVSITSIMSHAVSVLSMKAKEKNLQLEYTSEGPVPAVIEVDEVRIKQTLINLVGNAIKFTEEGGVTIRTRMTEINDKQMLGIDVIDTGIGMSPEQMAKIFNPFSQADESVTRKYGGTGLGLAICKQLVEKMGGEISVTSVPGQGSTFSLMIDPGCITDVEMMTIEKNTTHHIEPTEKTSTQVRFSDTRILVVDDGESNRELVGLLLRRSGAVVEFAENGQIAVDKCQSDKFDAVLMDMQMPVMDGFTATRELRKLGFQLPIVALTANAMQQDEIECRAAGCDEFLPKPISRDRLHQILAKVLPGKAQIETNPAPEQPAPDPKEPTPERSNAAVQEENVLQQVEETQAIVSAQMSEPELVSDLPMDDDDFRLIVEIFAGRLREKVVSMVEAGKAKEFDKLAGLAHWLKGSGGTAGFNDFTAPAKKLQEAAESQDESAMFEYLNQVVSLTTRIKVKTGDEVEQYM